MAFYIKHQFLANFMSIMNFTKLNGIYIDFFYFPIKSKPQAIGKLQRTEIWVREL